jgi:hypothetical protein
MRIKNGNAGCRRINQTMKQIFIEELNTSDNMTMIVNRQSNWFHRLERMKTNGSVRGFYRHRSKDRKGGGRPDKKWKVHFE